MMLRLHCSAATVPTVFEIASRCHKRPSCVIHGSFWLSPPTGQQLRNLQTSFAHSVAECLGDLALVDMWQRAHNYPKLPQTRFPVYESSTRHFIVEKPTWLAYLGHIQRVT